MVHLSLFVLGITLNIVGIRFDSWRFWAVVIPTALADFLLPPIVL